MPILVILLLSVAVSFLAGAVAGVLYFCGIDVEGKCDMLIDWLDRFMKAWRRVFIVSIVTDDLKDAASAVCFSLKSSWLKFRHKG